MVLSTGEEIATKAVISNADPKRTLLKLVDPTHLTPDFVMKLQHYRTPGTGPLRQRRFPMRFLTLAALAVATMSAAPARGR